MKAKIIFVIILELMLTQCHTTKTTISTEMPSNEKMSRVDSMAVILSGIYGLDQGIRDNSNLWGQSKRLREHTDSVCYEKALSFIRTYGYPHNLGKYSGVEPIEAAIPVVLLHSPHRLKNPEVYQLLRSEIKAGRMNPEMLALATDRYYVTYEKRTIHNSPYAQTLPQKRPYRKDKLLSDSLRLDINLLPLPDSVFVD